MSKAPLQLSEKDNRIYVKSTRKIEWRKKKKKEGQFYLEEKREKTPEKDSELVILRFKTY